MEKLVIGLVDEKAPEKLRLAPKGQEYDLATGAFLPFPFTGSITYRTVSDCVLVGENRHELHCYVSPQKWSSVDRTLSAVTVAAAISAIEQTLRPKTRDAWDEYSKSWSFANYEPLISQEGGKWHTDCLEIRPQG